MRDDPCDPAFLAVAIAIAFALYVFVALQWSYSKGERAGLLQEVSNKAWICKTREGELSLVALPGTAPEKFLFTVRDEAVAQKVNPAAGKRATRPMSSTRACPLPVLAIQIIL